MVLVCCSEAGAEAKPLPFPRTISRAVFLTAGKSSNSREKGEGLVSADSKSFWEAAWLIGAGQVYFD
jgi:hypothetical protein